MTAENYLIRCGRAALKIIDEWEEAGRDPNGDYYYTGYAPMFALGGEHGVTCQVCANDFDDDGSGVLKEHLRIVEDN